jgi:aryl-alcohol dehydrogenase-like predicted oxidoreductase
MEYRVLGRTGAKVSVLCLGCMNFGGPTDEAESHRILDRAFEAGLNFWDTANVYARQESERILGRWFAQRGSSARDQIFLATKVHGRVGEGPNDAGNHRYHVIRQVEASLRRLQTDRIDLYYFHRPDPETPIEEQIAVMDDLVRQGKIVYYGTSHYPAWMIMHGLWIADRSGRRPWVADQPRYSLVDRAIEQDIVPFCRATGYALVPHSPLAGGFLTGKYQRGAPPPEGTRLARQPNRFAEFGDAHWALLDRLMAVSREIGCTPGQAAIAWVLSRPFVTSSIIGPRTLEQFEENLGAVQVKLPDETVRALDDASAFAARLPRA